MYRTGSWTGLWGRYCNCHYECCRARWRHHGAPFKISISLMTLSLAVR
jgi:hypothetical protein